MERIDPAFLEKEIGKKEIINKTLDAINKPLGSSTKKDSTNKAEKTDKSMESTYELSKSILSSAYEDKGIAINKKS